MSGRSFYTRRDKEGVQLMGLRERELADLIRRNCLDCSGASQRATAPICSTVQCLMYPIKKARYRGSEDDLLKAARAYCLECMGDSRALVRDCTNASCRMYRIRDVAALSEG